MSNDLVSNKDVLVPNKSTELTTRTWRTEPDGEFDRPVEIWFNANWVPAFFSDIKAGDFYLDLNIKLEPGRCFRAASNAKRIADRSDTNPTYLIARGCEVVQAPYLQVEMVINPDNRLEGAASITRIKAAPREAPTDVEPLMLESTKWIWRIKHAFKSHYFVCQTALGHFSLTPKIEQAHRFDSQKQATEVLSQTSFFFDIVVFECVMAEQAEAEAKKLFIINDMIPSDYETQAMFAQVSQALLTTLDRVHRESKKTLVPSISDLDVVNAAARTQGE